MFFYHFYHGFIEVNGNQHGCLFKPNKAINPTATATDKLMP
jgi:hypothetical protein